MIFRKDLDVSDAADRRNRPPRNMLIRVRPGTTAEFEERLVKRLQAAAPDWSFEVHAARRDADAAPSSSRSCRSSSSAWSPRS